ncbi:MAG: polysaccharide deacetylase family protein [Sulfuricurvum sp.]|uniref:polysaccharide deacetylase family protein n=1 Tax=Sulfuricurvum sp. TaxID=2025608 RepID=UPI002638FB19|nr:polysaccharide deacetylase family protein [Sulfuricurvum sp.]MDD2829262.1 polysaccharide deacetylase family protein [Sulfuricurvum sp.]MDD4949974.1 polysaccharide deacetylase family protein [Sulfuricurvum sp.]
MKLFYMLIFIFSTTLLGDTVYDIRGTSPLLDANMTQFLEQWRTDTVAPIQHGEYTNVFVNGESTKKIIALTFDDAPDENNTHLLLDILDKHGVKASFFMIGATMNDENITSVKRAFNEGHLVLNHTFNHPRLTNLENNTTILQLERTASRIEEITGKYPLLMRPPYGSINTQVVNAVNGSGYTTILWSLDSLDWTLKDPYAVANNVIGNIRNGDIILMHRNRTSVASLEMIIETLHSIGYTFTTLDKLLGIKAYR